MSASRPGRIRILPEAVASRIAAGEVIERPASVVRELLDNALDAQATRIHLTLSLPGGPASDADFWKHFALTVRDDGIGMHPEDLQRAFAKHATSKITDIEDVFTTPTLGFRGEALAAIASVARVEAVSSDETRGEGFRLRLEGGALTERAACAASRGTLMRVEDLFYNAPARRKFLRSPQAEKAEIRREFLHRSLAHPKVHFTFATCQAGQQEEIELDIPGGLDLRGRISRFWSSELAAALLPVDFADGPIRITGFISSHRHRARNRSTQFFFHKNRPIVNATLSAAFSHAYLNLLPSRCYGACFLTLHFPDHDVDVNVHPQKRDVRFRDPDAAYRLVHHAVKETLRASLEQGARATSAPSSGTRDDRPNIFSLADGGGNRPVAYTLGKSATPGESGERQTAFPGIGEGSASGFGRRVLGQLEHLFVVFTDGASLLVADQHAMDERIHFDRLSKRLQDSPGASQPLLTPMVIPGSRLQIEQLLAASETLKALGFILSPFGEGALQVEELPDWIPAERASSVARDFLEDFMENPAMGVAELREHALATSACHLSVRAGEPLSFGIMQDLIERFYAGGHADVCPHGRPFLFRVGSDTLRQHFDRPACGRGLTSLPSENESPQQE